MRADWYEFPGWYDILHAPGTAAEVDGLERIERRFVRVAPRASRRWLEPACGSARYLRVAAGRGVRVAGFDLSPRMVDYARESFRRRGLQGALAVGNMESFRLASRATFAFCLINTIRHLMSDRAMRRHLACMRSALVPGGVYVVGIETCRYESAFPEEDVWTGARGRAKITQVIGYTPPSRRERIERVHSHLLIRTPSSEQHLDTDYALRAYSRREWLELLDSAGWRVLGVSSPDGRDALRAPDGGPVGGYGLYVLAPVARAR